MTAGVILSWRGRQRWGRRLTVAACGGYLAIMALPIHGWVLEPLEQRFPAPRAMPSDVAGIIVLGGAVDTLLTARHGMPSLNDAAERMTTFAKLARLYPSAKLVFTGGSGLLSPGSLTEADVARQLLADLGLDTGRILFEDQSRNTFENAELSKKRARPRQGETWILITSASHMPRSVGVFRAVGWDILPWPVAYKAEEEYDLNLSEHLQHLDWGVHEWIGLVSYRLLGRTPALFPAP